MEKFGPIRIILVLSLYFIPSIIGFARNHSNSIGIFLLNLLLGWTFLGWIGAFIWSLTSAGKQTIVVNNTYSEVRNNAPKPEEKPVAATFSKGKESYDQKLEHLQKLKQMLDNGILSEEEFRKEKSKILAD